MKKNYESPQIEIIDIEVEKGYGNSIEPPVGGGNHGWDQVDKWSELKTSIQRQGGYPTERLWQPRFVL